MRIFPDVASSNFCIRVYATNKYNEIELLKVKYAAYLWLAIQSLLFSQNTRYLKINVKLYAKFINLPWVWAYNDSREVRQKSVSARMTTSRTGSTECVLPRDSLWQTVSLLHPTAEVVVKKLPSNKVYVVLAILKFKITAARFWSAWSLFFAVLCSG